MTIDKKHPHGVLGASLAMGSRGIIPAEAVESKSPRPGREWWDRLCALPRHMFLLKPSSTGVQKLEDPSGNWIDVHDAQRLMDGAQSDINELRGEVERLKAENTALRCAGEIVAGAIPRLGAARARNAALEGLLRKQGDHIATLADNTFVYSSGIGSPIKTREVNDAAYAALAHGQIVNAALAEGAKSDPHDCNECAHPECGRYDGPHKVECRAMADNACARPAAEGQGDE